jgi:hypothetical protein
MKQCIRIEFTISWGDPTRDVYFVHEDFLSIYFRSDRSFKYGNFEGIWCVLLWKDSTQCLRRDFGSSTQLPFPKSLVTEKGISEVQG